MTTGNRCIYCGRDDARRTRSPHVLRCPDCGQEFDLTCATVIRTLRRIASRLDPVMWKMVGEIVATQNLRLKGEVPMMLTSKLNVAIYVESSNELVVNYFGGDNVRQGKVTYPFDVGAFLGKEFNSFLISLPEYLDPLGVISINWEKITSSPPAMEIFWREGGKKESIGIVTIAELNNFRTALQRFAAVHAD